MSALHAVRTQCTNLAYEQVVALGSLHKRTFNWKDCTFYMSV